MYGEYLLFPTKIGCLYLYVNCIIIGQFAITRIQDKITSEQL